MALAGVVFGWLAGAASAQNGTSAGWEIRRDRSTYHFDNPSSFDTGDHLVPHFFEQTYDSDNQWLVMRTRFRALGLTWITSGGIAFWGTGQGDDYDTFFQPGGDVVVYGTTAVTELDSFRIAQHYEMGSPSAWRFRMGYSWRRDRANFLPSDSITQHSQPPSEARFFNPGREVTYSDVHGLQVGLARRHQLANQWSLEWTIDAMPITVARLNTVLPDKYPGRDIIFIAKSFSLEPSVRVSRAIDNWRIEIQANYSESLPYSDSHRFAGRWFGAGVSLGR